MGFVILCLYAIYTGILLVYQIPIIVDCSIQIVFLILFTLLTLFKFKDLLIFNLVILVVVVADLALTISSLHTTVNLSGVLRLIRVAILVLQTVKV